MMLLGCIGDDFTGSSDLGNTLVKAGMRTVQYVGVPDRPAASEVEAGIVALKSRTVPVKEAIRMSLAALDWLLAQGCEQILFKYCSTFDSTPDGNIGPVCQALADRLGADRVIICPAFPAAGRSVYQGHLFVNDRLLSESGMENHPLTPMTESDLRRWLALQVAEPIGHLPASVVFQGTHAISAHLQTETARLIVCDAIRDDDLLALGAAADGSKLVTGGSGIAKGLPENFRRAGRLTQKVTDWRGEAGRAAVLAGSCSTATREQVARHAGPRMEVSAEKLMAGEVSAEDAAQWALAQQGLPLLYSSAEPEVLQAARDRFGREVVAARIEEFFAETAKALIAGGVSRLITAGGETSGAVVEALAPDALDIGPEIAPGVPCLRAGSDLVMALKSGNFGGPDFFAQANAMLGAEE